MPPPPLFIAHPTLHRPRRPHLAPRAWLPGLPGPRGLAQVERAGQASSPNLVVWIQLCVHLGLTGDLLVCVSFLMQGAVIRVVRTFIFSAWFVCDFSFLVEVLCWKQSGCCVFKR